MLSDASEPQIMIRSSLSVSTFRRIRQPFSASRLSTSNKTFLLVVICFPRRGRRCSSIRWRSHFSHIRIPKSFLYSALLRISSNITLFENFFNFIFQSRYKGGAPSAFWERFLSGLRQVFCFDYHLNSSQGYPFPGLYVS